MSDRMNHRIKVLVSMAALVTTLGFSSLGRADAPVGDCGTTYGRVGILDYETTQLQDGSCVLQMTPDQYTDSTYRSYLFDNRGVLMIFNNTPGSDATSAGARSYFFFPRLTMPVYQASADGSTISVTHTSGIIFNFSSKSAKLVSIPGVDFTLDPVISMTNNGGLDITAAPGVWLDTGWQTGGASYQDPSRHSTLHSGPNSCDLLNSELFNIVDTSPVFKFPEDKDFAAFIRTRCPNLDVSALNT